MTRRMRVALFVLTLVCIFSSAILFWAWHAWTQGSSDHQAEELTIQIPAGASATDISLILSNDGLLEHERIFRLGVRLAGYDAQLRAGRFVVPAGASPRDIAQILASGPIVTVPVTLIEGESADQYLSLLAGSLDCDELLLRQAFTNEIKNVFHQPDWLSHSLADYQAALDLAELSLGHPPVFGEGYLLPDTYRFVEGAAPELIARTLVHATLDTLGSLLGAHVHDSRIAHLRPHDVLTLASIVEAETPLVAEMPLVAAVYLNRLARNHPLEADPTVAYALDKIGERLFYRDLEVESPFNTYRQRGLPPGPIGCPGRAAIAAVISPDPDRTVFYFVADGLGGHVFSETWAEHQQAVAAYRKAKGRR
jgi:UPF0755 protein